MNLFKSKPEVKKLKQICKQAKHRREDIINYMLVWCFSKECYDLAIDFLDKNKDEVLRKVISFKDENTMALKLAIELEQIIGEGK